MIANNGYSRLWGGTWWDVEWDNYDNSCSVVANVTKTTSGSYLVTAMALQDPHGSPPSSRHWKLLVGYRSDVAWYSCWCPHLSSAVGVSPAWNPQTWPYPTVAPCPPGGLRKSLPDNQLRGPATPAPQHICKCPGPVEKRSFWCWHIPTIHQKPNGVSCRTSIIRPLWTARPIGRHCLQIS